MFNVYASKIIIFYFVRVTKMTLNKKDADFLFGMVDKDNDGVINTDTELVLELEHQKFLS